RGKRSEFVRMRAEGKSGKFRDFLCGASRKFRMRIQSRSHCGPANRQTIQAIERDGDAAAITVEQIHPAGKFLVYGERSRVLQMRAPDFHDAFEFGALGV